MKPPESFGKRPPYAGKGPRKGPPKGSSPSRPPEDLLYGLHALREALNAGKQLDRVLVDKEALNPQVQALVGRLRELEVPLQFVPREAIERQATGRNHQGVLGFLPAISYRKLEDVLPALLKQPTAPVLVLLDGVTDVRNVGAIARSVEVLGGHALVLPSQGSARINADAVKTSAGALQHLPVCRVATVKHAVAELKAHGIRVVALTEKAPHSLNLADLSGPICLLIGDEGEGIQPGVLSACDMAVHIPMQGKISSLNVSVAAGVALYEIQRQRQV